MRLSSAFQFSALSFITLCVFLAIAAAAVGHGNWRQMAAAEPNEPSQQQAEQRDFGKWATEAAASYDVRLQAAPDMPLALRREPVLRWSNPERGRIYGDVFIWTADGRPEAIASLYKWYHPFTHSSHEFQSLSLGSLQARRGGAAAWTTSRPGLDLRPLSDAPPPADDAAPRLRQMRMLVRQFRAEETNREGERSQLRLLPQPVYRYEQTKGDLLDGALFAFVQATDPEILLLIEARRDAKERAAWQYGLARLNSIAMRAFHQDREVWTAAELPWSAVQDRSQPYFTVRFQ